MDILTTPSGISYYKIGSGPDVKIYMDGWSEKPNPLASSFYNKLLPSIKDRVTCYMAIPLPKTGWEKPWNGTMMGTDFLNFVADQHPESTRIFLSGYSAGGDPGYVYAAKRITAFASVAGSDLNGYNGMMEWRKKKIPVWSFIGTHDGSENSKANCEKTWITWYQYGNNMASTPIDSLYNNCPTYVSGDHLAVDDYAYNPANGLWEWFDSIGQAAPPQPSVDDPVVKSYYRPSEDKLIMETESGLTLKFQPVKE